MKEKVFEILVYLMSEIQDNKALHEIDLDTLETQGYTQSEISAAFSWIVEHVPAQEDGRIPLEGTGQGSRRILHSAEKLMLTTESQGYLIQLTELGLLDDAGLESVIDRAMATGQERLTVPELRQIAEGVVFGVEHRGAGSGLTMLDPGDTIH
jgi:uncharacterized protein Smg (DUF494 family)